MRRTQWKYIEPAKKQEKAELYDLANDLAESKNIVADNPEIAARLAGLLDRARSKPRTRPRIAGWLHLLSLSSLSHSPLT
jgi:hypothetical protein